MGKQKSAKDKTPQFKPPANPREALKRLNSTISNLKRSSGLEDTKSLMYFSDARKLTKYLEGFVELVERTTSPERPQREDSNPPFNSDTETDPPKDTETGREKDDVNQPDSGSVDEENNPGERDTSGEEHRNLGDE